MLARRDRLAHRLGLFSLALAGPPLASPAGFSAALGTGVGPDQLTAAKLVGTRELLVGLPLLARPNAFWLWSRVAGDAMDLTLLARALRHHNGRGRNRTVAATAAVGVIAVIDLYAAISRSRKESAVQLRATTTIGKPPHEVYDFWRRLDHLGEFMAHVDEVTTTGTDTSHWVVSAPFGRTVEWDATVTDDQPGRRIAWKSSDDADIANEGVVEFVPAPGGRGAEVRVTIDYRVPGGKLGEAIARYFGEDPHQQLDDDLRRLKQVLETGEVVRSDGAPYGKQARGEFPQHAAQPLTDAEYAEFTELAGKVGA